jgi:dsRNA-specific ribonuclease
MSYNTQNMYSTHSTHNMQNMPVVIDAGIRGPEFTDAIKALLRKGNIADHYIDILMNEESISIYNEAFTSMAANPTNNYEVSEQLGDVLAGSFIVWYMYRRFPKLCCSQGVKIVARLKIKYGSREVFSDIADKLGFWRFITATTEEKMRKKKDLLEDVFEAFIGATASILDTRIRLGVGYAIVYDILASIFDEIPISLKYENLYDAITRLKELFDTFGNRLGIQEKTNYKSDVVDSSGVPRALTTVVLYSKYDRREEIGRGTAAKKADAEQKAAESAIELLNRRGFVKVTRDSYLYD